MIPDTPIPTPSPPVAAPSSLRRRDFFTGGLAGLVIGGPVGLLTGRSQRPGELSCPSDPVDGLPKGVHASFAQCGEDLILMWWMNALNVTTPTYLDIGAWEPIESSNTYRMYRGGGRGVLVEPNPSLADKIRATRPRDTLLSVGVGLTDSTEADYFMFNDSQLNTFDRGQVERVLKEPRVQLEKTLKIPLMSINRVIAEHLGGKAPDLLSIDIEGLDLACLKTVDWVKYRPKVVCAETLITLTKSHNPETSLFMEGVGYAIRGMTYANTFYVDKALLN